MEKLRTVALLLPCSSKLHRRVSDAAALLFVNQYWPVFYKELLPFAAEGWDEFLRGTLNKLFLQVPFNTIFPAN